MGDRRTRYLRVDRDRLDEAVLRDAADVLRRGGLVAFPTETVYGLGAHALDAAAVQGIFEAKGRPSTDPVIVHVADAGSLEVLARDVPDTARLLAARFWPGPLTLILSKQPVVPDIVTAGLDSVAIRVPAHPVAHGLLAEAGVPVAAPSANRFSRPSPTCADHVRADLDGRIDVVLDAGPTDIGVESTIVDCRDARPVLRRAGGITREQLQAVVPDLAATEVAGAAHEAQRAPGQLLRHYAPNAPVTVYDGSHEAVVARISADARTEVAAGKRVGLLAPDDRLVALAPHIAAQAAAGRIVTASLGPSHAPDAAARALFGALRALDAAAVDVILASGPDRAGLGAAVWDRLRRASEGRVRRV